MYYSFYCLLPPQPWSVPERASAAPAIKAVPLDLHAIAWSPPAFSAPSLGLGVGDGSDELG